MAAINAKQLNNGYFLLPYAIAGKAPAKSKAVNSLLGGAPADVQTDSGYKAFKDLTYSSRVLFGLIHTEEKIFGHAAELSYREITKKTGHSSRTTAANLKEGKEILEKPLKSTYHINVEYDGKPFILCYEFLFNEELQLGEGQACVQLTDLEAMLVSLIVNNKLNPKKHEDFNASITNIAKALNIPNSTAKSLIDRLIIKGVCTCYRQYKDEKGNVIREENAKAKTKKEQTILTVKSRFIRRCNVIFKEYKKRYQQRAKQRDVSKRNNGKRPAAQPEQPKELTDQEKFDEIEAKFIRDKKYLNLTEKYNALKAQSIDAIVKEKDEAKQDALNKAARDTFNELCNYIHNNGVDKEKIPKTLATLIRNL